jgi:dihydroxyacid dehydratase/phosphogluconate dehydratase
LAHVDHVRRSRGEAPFFATFAPAHVLEGGSIPDDVITELEELAKKAELEGASDVAIDLRDTMAYILQCSSNTAFQGVFERAYERGIITKEQHKYFEMRLAVATCDGQGGVCAFNGTGNSSRHLVAGMGLVHPAVELLTDPPTQRQINAVLDSFATMINEEKYGVSNIVAANIKNAIRIHSASGGSTNLMMHIVAGMLYAGYKFSLWDLDRIHHEHPIPDLFDYSLTEGRDIYSLAMQCCSGTSRGMETLFYELLENGVPMDQDAPTVAARTWRERLAITQSLKAVSVKENPVILSTPRRTFSGVDVLQGNFFESAVVKISGMPTPQLDQFDDKLAFVLYFENEDDANKSLLDSNLLNNIKEKKLFDHNLLLETLKYNNKEEWELLKEETYEKLFDEMAEKGILKISVVIAGQGPVAFGMPEMFTPMQHINANRVMKKLATIISDGRYSGVTYGAAIGHMTPEAYEDGGIGFLQTGDIVIHLFSDSLKEDRRPLAEERKQRMKARQKMVAASNRMYGHTDAANGVVPLAVVEDAVLDYEKDILIHEKSTISK